MDALTRLGISIPSASRLDSPDVVRDARAIGLALEAKGAFITTGTYASRPTSSVGTPGQVGRYYYATDRDALYQDTGTSWSLIAAPGAKSNFISSEGGPLDGGPFQYSMGGNGGLGAGAYALIVPYSTNTPATMSLAVSGLYPIEFKAHGWIGTYAGPGSQYVALRVRNPSGTVIMGPGVAGGDVYDQAVFSTFTDFHLSRLLTVARIAANGGAGTWNFDIWGAADGVRTAGIRHLMAIVRERSDLIAGGAA